MNPEAGPGNSWAPAAPSPNAQFRAAKARLRSWLHSEPDLARRILAMPHDKAVETLTALLERATADLEEREVSALGRDREIARAAGARAERRDAAAAPAPTAEDDDLINDEDEMFFTQDDEAIVARVGAEQIDPRLRSGTFGGPPGRGQ